jgi:hypothetical protein
LQIVVRRCLDKVFLHELKKKKAYMKNMFDPHSDLNLCKEGENIGGNKNSSRYCADPFS